MRTTKIRPDRERLVWTMLIVAFLFAVFAPRLETISLAQSSGGPYRLQQSVIANGGGGPSTGTGNLSIEGTAGQPVAGDLYRNPPFSHNAGFWFGPTIN